ncbi:MAG TPA: nucleotidyltransferase domain-containing protein [Candidatus Nanoarchaeia archaeon]|nr:nucleotidyltransferase domain-containing protein [Candidatus Nanoarchaeia archaeon]
MVNIYKLKLTILQQKILRLLFVKAGMSLNARGVARILEVSQPAVSKALPKLEEMNFINVKKDKDSKRLSIELNTENHKVLWLKRADNLKQLYDSGLVQFLYDSFPGSTVILFGSYAFGEDTSISDIDLAVVGSKPKEIDLAKFEKVLERAIIINYYNSFRDIDNHLLNNILNGITIKGAVEL